MVAGWNDPGCRVRTEWWSGSTGPHERDKRLCDGKMMLSESFIGSVVFRDFHSGFFHSSESCLLLSLYASRLFCFPLLCFVSPSLWGALEEFLLALCCRGPSALCLSVLVSSCLQTYLCPECFFPYPCP